MAHDRRTFGGFIVAKRNELRLSQKDLAAAIDISPSYLNDIEHDRRNPTDNDLMRKLSVALKVQDKVDYLYYLAGRFPEDVRAQNLAPDDVVSAMRNLRKHRPSAR